MNTEVYNGHVYQIQYVPEESNWDYTQHHTYHIRTDVDDSIVARKAIEHIMNDGSWDESTWKTKNKDNSSMTNALHSYHRFRYDDRLNCYVYTLVRPYDD